MSTTPIRIGWLILSTGLFALIGYSVPRDQFPLLMTLYALLMWGYWLRIRPIQSRPTTEPDSPDPFLFSAAVGFRLVLLVALPALSDDYARFIWDGRLLIHGVNPYLYRPDQLIGTPLAAVAGLDQSLFASLNSPAYYSVYPPVNQALFALAAGLAPGSVLGTVVGLKIMVVLAEMGSLWLMVKLLRRVGQPANLALLYGLNPLVILEGAGNVHMEAVMIFFVLLAAWLFSRNRPVWSAGALALAVGTKLLPLLLFPLIIRCLGWKRGVRYTALTGLLVAMLFLPFASLNAGLNIFASLDLYFEMFEFNASLYPLIRETVVRGAGNWTAVGSRLTTAVGFLIAVVTTGGIGWIAFGGRRAGWAALTNRLLVTLTVYFALATTVHPWYITSLVAASVFTRFRYPLLWSGLIWLSYATYRTVPYQENTGLKGLEYGLLLAYAGYEWYRARERFQS